MRAPDDFEKSRPDAPEGFFEAEAAGLRWLAAAREADPRAARVVDVREAGPGWIRLERLRSASPSARAARELGTALARTHAAGAAGFGAPPEGWSGPTFIGRQRQSCDPEPRWGRFYAEQRVRPFAERARERGHLDARAAAVVAEACARIADGTVDDDEPPARLHGDLWSGNVAWTPEGAVLIDPAAHGGHRETDLAMLELFGLPYLGELLEGYESERPLRAGWRDRVPVHQLHPLAVHAASHGAGYAAPLLAAARATLALI
ncbi:MAG: fructosamine kinase family protein [Actinomycetales bacterium]|nr:fructosamine kinase family protein [Actinomycetales bacterium]